MAILSQFLAAVAMVIMYLNGQYHPDQRPIASRAALPWTVLAILFMTSALFLAGRCAF